jgi:hypothetical protein
MSKAPIIKAEEPEVPEADEVVETRKLYRLRRPYWDGRMDHAVGDVLYFEPGEQPSTAVLVDLA